jgi:hypothetical protein
MRRGGEILINELNDIAYMKAHPEVCQMFKEAGYYKFCEKLQGSHQGVVEAFSLSFDGVKAKVGTVEMYVDEALIEIATKIPSIGERWFKTTITKDI